jgi:sulfur carrier protein
MQILINGKPQQLEQSLDLYALLQTLGYNGSTFAVALNGDFVARENYVQVIVNDKDALDIVAPVVGG